MNEIILLRPTKQYTKQVMTLREEMLRLILGICREFGEHKILVACDKENEASRRTIMKNGGVLENEVSDTVGLSKSGLIQRYWITI